MTIDVTGLKLLSGSKGNDCMGNGKHRDEKGKALECCCDECEYLLVAP